VVVGPSIFKAYVVILPLTLIASIWGMNVAIPARTAPRRSG
jgi:hypothetical protein